MTKKEAQQFVAALQRGKIFGTRFQEEEWGIKYLAEENLFKKWSRRVTFFTNSEGKMDAKQDYNEEKMTESSLIAYLMEHYAYKTMAAKLRDA